MAKRNPNNRTAHLKRIAAQMDNVSWNVERVADQLRDSELAATLREAVKLNRRYAKWIVIEAERRTERTPESS